MVLPAESQPRATYLLWHPFYYPTIHGHEAAIAVSRSSGDSITAIYSLLLEIMLAHFFQMLVLVCVHFGNRSPSGFIHRISKSFYENDPTLPVIRLLKSLPFLSKFILSQGFPGYQQATILVLVGLVILFVPKVVPAFAIHGLLIGSGAPVNPAQIYVPASAFRQNISDIGIQIPLEALSKPRFLRAVGQVETASADTLAKVSVSQLVLLQDLGNGEKIQRIDYNYSVTAQEFGLQNFHGLTLNVQGSCHTEYGWNYASNETSGIPMDYYNIFGNESLPFYATPYYGYTPIAYADIPWGTSTINNTYAIMISSMQCESFTIGTDPWYLTATTGVSVIEADWDLVYDVLPRRPALSSWQMDEWTYEGQTSATYDLPSLPGLGFPTALRDVFFSQLGTPTIYNAVTSLGSIALSSSTTAQTFTIDAGSSSIYNDLRRLALTSYISTINLLLDTTLYNQNFTYGIPSIVSPGDLGTVSQFVVYDQNIATISLAFGVAIPIATLIMYLAVTALKAYIKPIASDEENGAVVFITEHNASSNGTEKP